MELIEDLVRDEGVETVSLYKNGEFEDLCRGPHGPSTGRIKAIKLSSVAGAYWRGDENRARADPDLRHRLLLQEGPGTAPGADRGSESPRPPPARPPARHLHAARRGAGNALLAAQRDHAAAPDRARGPGAAAQARLPGDRHPAGARRAALAPLRSLGQLPRRDVLHGRRRAPFRAAADELSRAPASSTPPTATPTASCRCAWPSSAASPATSARASCTGCCGSAPSPRTTPTSTAPRSRSPTRSPASARRSTSSTPASASRTSKSSSRPGRRSRWAPRSSGRRRRRR